MSRVTIDDIQHDASGLDDMSWAEITKLYQIEVVPRKMVEMIIEKCADHASGPTPSDYTVGVSNEADWIKRYAESLLNEFENGKI